ncbi:MAG: hydroxymethylbilane synthase [Elusimicrobiota bacterium]
MKREILKMGTRGSALARAQSSAIAEAIKASVPDVDIETIVIRTSGDAFAPELNQEAAPPVEAGLKGLFVKEIEDALLQNRIDFAVHSAKDLPAALAQGLAVAAYPKREDPRDVFIGRRQIRWSSLPNGALIGTSSLRRKLQILAAKPGSRVIVLRGNIDTRIKKIDGDALDGIVVAAAGINRLGLSELARDALSPDTIVPAPGQGALAVEIRQEDSKTSGILAQLDDFKTRQEVELERAVSAALGGSCSTPLGILAQSADGVLSLKVFWAKTEHARATRLDRVCPNPMRWRQFAQETAAILASS